MFSFVQRDPPGLAPAAKEKMATEVVVDEIAITECVTKVPFFLHRPLQITC